jgi:hypothetical protein
MSELLQMRFTEEFWSSFFELAITMQEKDLINLADLDAESANLFFTSLATKLILEVGADDMPNLDDTIKMIRVVLAEEIKETRIRWAMNALTNLTETTNDSTEQ